MVKKYPNITVRLTGVDGSPQNIMGICQHAMKRDNCSDEQVNDFVQDAQSGDYDHMIQTCIRYFNIE